MTLADRMGRSVEPTANNKPELGRMGACNQCSKYGLLYRRRLARTDRYAIANLCYECQIKNGNEWMEHIRNNDNKEAT